MEYSNLCYPFIFYKKKVNKLCCIVRLSWVSWLWIWIYKCLRVFFVNNGETDEGSRHGGEQIKLQILLVYFINVPVWCKVGSLIWGMDD